MSNHKLQSGIKLLCLAVAIFAVAITGARSANAHAVPTDYAPKASANLSTMPAEISIRFSERVEPSISTIEVLDAQGQRINTDTATVDKADPYVLQTAIDTKPQGNVTVSWFVISADDGHFTKGAFGFSVGTSKTGAGGTVAQPIKSQFEVNHNTTLAEAITIWLELLGQAILFSILVLYALIWRPLQRNPETALPTETANFKRRYRVTISAGVALIIIGTLAYVGLESFTLHTLRAIPLATALAEFSHTFAGSLALWRATLAILFGLVFLVSARRILRNQRWTINESILEVVLLIIEFIRVRVSHAAASPLLPDLSIIINLIHLIFKNLWVGGLIVFTMAFLPIMLRSRKVSSIIYSLLTFSKLMALTISLTAISGSYIIWLHLKNLANLWTTEWGIGLATLTVFGVIMLLLRTYHQFFFEPKLMTLINQTDADEQSKVNQLSPRQTEMLELFSTTTALETMSGIVMLLVTGILIITTPPLNTIHNFEKVVSAPDYAITLAEHPAEDGKFLITFNNTDSSHKTPISSLAMSATNTDRNIGPLAIKPEQRFDGGYTFSESDLSPPGIWKISVNGHRTGDYDAIAEFTVDYPQEITATQIAPEQRSFGFLELALIMGSIFVSAIAVYGYRFSQSLQSTTTRVDTTKAKTAIKDQIIGLMAQTQGSWFISAIIMAVIASAFLGFHGSHPGFFRTQFEQACEKAGYTWHENHPERDGQVTSSNSVIGCTLTKEGYHFIDQKGFEYFMRQTSPTK